MTCDVRILRLGCMGEEGIKKDVMLRRQLQRRWGGMLERRAVRTGRYLDGAASCPVLSLFSRSTETFVAGQSKIRSQIQDDYRYSGAGVGPEAAMLKPLVLHVLSIPCPTPI